MQTSRVRTLTIHGMIILVWVLISVTAIRTYAAPSHTSTEDYPADVVIAWFTLQTQLVQETPGFSPPVASRAFGYTGVTLYESVVPGFAMYQSLVGQINGLNELPQPAAELPYYWPAVANSALATISRHLFATASDENQANIDALYLRFANQYKDEVDGITFARSVAQGRMVADAVFIWSLNDGGHQGELTSFYEDYVPPAGAGLWIPTLRDNGDPLPALQPYWGENRPFVLSSGAECAPVAPPAYSEASTSTFYQEAAEVYYTVNQLTPEQREIAQFWADNPVETATPPGHSIAIMNQLLEEQNASLAFAAEGYARLGIALTDSFIACWHTKYTYNLLRPITYIQSVIDPAWNAVISTPPFPEYPSGHSVQSGAAAEVFAGLFGENYAFDDHTHVARGFPPRHFDSFTEFAEEAAISRLYGGIHFRSAIEQGLEQGRCIGRRVNSLALRR